jgi:hypothetical protein
VQAHAIANINQSARWSIRDLTLRGKQLAKTVVMMLLLLLLLLHVFRVIMVKMNCNQCVLIKMMITCVVLAA